MGRRDWTTQGWVAGLLEGGPARPLGRFRDTGTGHMQDTTAGTCRHDVHTEPMLYIEIADLVVHPACAAVVLRSQVVSSAGTCLDWRSAQTLQNFTKNYRERTYTMINTSTNFQVRNTSSAGAIACADIGPPSSNAITRGWAHRPRALGLKQLLLI